MSINFDFTKQINGVAVGFSGTVNDAGEALKTITALMADVATAVTAKTTVSSTAKNSTADASANPSTDAKTPTASDSSANSSNASPDADAGTKTTATDTKPADENVIEYEYDKHVKPLVLAISKKSTDWAKALLQRHGAVDGDGKASAKLLKPAQYPAFVKDAQAVVDGKLDPTASADGDGDIA